MRYDEHLIVWTDEKINRFWQHYWHNTETCPAFAEEAGGGLLKLARKCVPLRGDILDYGTGRGALVEHILNQNLGRVTACEFVRDCVRLVNAKSAGDPRFQGCVLIESLPSSLKANAFDVVLFVEIIEHLSETYFDATIKELVRVMKPGGHLIVTTRNNEQLALSNAHCPDCGAIFHRVQHLRQFTLASITRLFQSYGLQIRYAKGVNLTELGSGRYAKRLLKFLTRHHKRYAPPHLVCICRKPSSFPQKTT